MIFDDIWWLMVTHVDFLNQFWWYLMIFDDIFDDIWWYIWWYLMIFDDIWWSMVTLMLIFWINISRIFAENHEHHGHFFHGSVSPDPRFGTRSSWSITSSPWQAMPAARSPTSSAWPTPWTPGSPRPLLRGDFCVTMGVWPYFKGRDIFTVVSNHKELLESENIYNKILLEFLMHSGKAPLFCACLAMNSAAGGFFDVFCISH